MTDTRGRWGDRLLGVAVGAAVMGVVLWPDGDPPGVPDEPTVAAADPVAASQVATAAAVAPDLGGSEQPLAPANADSTSGTDPQTDHGTSSSAGPTGDTEGDETGEADPVAREGAPSLPIVHLPGNRVARREQHFDEEVQAWVLIETVRVVAPESQAQTYYRKVLEDLGLRVHVADEPPTDRWSARSTIKGRARGHVVQVTLRQAASEMRTTVRVIWRIEPEEVDARGRMRPIKG